MKRLILKIPEYLQLEQEFREWLYTLGYAEKTVESLPVYIHELLHYLEQCTITNIRSVTPGNITSFLLSFKRRKNLTTGAGLSVWHINKCIVALNKFIEYLNLTGKHKIEVSLERESVNMIPRTILTREEMTRLYEATYTVKQRHSLAYGQRDRTILSVFYGCGLRMNEGLNLEINDIDFKKSLLHVRKGKGDKERYVPVTEKNLYDLEEYICNGRRWFMRCTIQNNERLLINYRSQNMTENGLYPRLKILCNEAGISKQVSLHTLRHSIATHLLQQGMSLENISLFLGHSTLDSTQIYTHIVNEML